MFWQHWIIVNYHYWVLGLHYLVFRSGPCAFYEHNDPNHCDITIAAQCRMQNLKQNTGMLFEKKYRFRLNIQKITALENLLVLVNRNESSAIFTSAHIRGIQWNVLPPVFVKLLKASRYGLMIFLSLWNLTGVSAALSAHNITTFVAGSYSWIVIAFATKPPVHAGVFKAY